jgi:hypothetical protein
MKCPQASQGRVRSSLGILTDLVLRFRDIKQLKKRMSWVVESAV